MAKYVTKPVEVDAWQFRDARNHWPWWISDGLMKGLLWYQGGEEPYLTIHSSTGSLYVPQGDWIVRSADGSMSVCKRDDFVAAYDRAA